MTLPDECLKNPSYLWVQRKDGTYEGAKVEQTIRDEMGLRYAVEFLNERGEQTDRLGLVWAQERNIAIGYFSNVENLIAFAEGFKSEFDQIFLNTVKELKEKSKEMLNELIAEEGEK
jgi:hypothetical protein